MRSTINKESCSTSAELLVTACSIGCGHIASNPHFGHYTHFSWWGFRYVKGDGRAFEPDRATADRSPKALIHHLEAVVIAAANPRHCEIAGDWRSVEEYAQVRDDRLDPDRSL